MITELMTRMKIKADRQSIYEAFVNPDQLKAFWFTYSSREWASDTTVQLGYAEFNAPPFAIHLQECIPGKKISFLWGDEDGGDRLVTITIEPLEDSMSLCSVREEGYRERIDTLPLLIGSKEGWVFMLTCLKAYLENSIDSLKLGLFIEDPDWQIPDAPAGKG